jgi:hypothetical protein
MQSMDKALYASGRLIVSSQMPLASCRVTKGPVGFVIVVTGSASRSENTNISGIIKNC